jgi:hypothetical protein
MIALLVISVLLYCWTDFAFRSVAFLVVGKSSRSRKQDKKAFITSSLPDEMKHGGLD